MSDLQCPCTALLLRPVTAGRARQVARAVEDRRVARVFVDAADGTAAAARTVAEHLGVVLEPFEEQTVGGAYAALEQISDAYRGETVLVVCDMDRFGTAYAGVELAEIEVDGDGWRRVDSW